VPCQPRNEELPTLRITQDMRNRLRSGKKENKSDVEKWTDVYKMIFPGAFVPDPCE
jgi:hypothetical protein